MIEDAGKDFFQEKERIYGEPATYRTFAHMYARRESSVVQLPGLLYVIAGRICFEDFEPSGGLEDFFRRKREAFVKFTAEEPLSSAVRWKQVGSRISDRFLLGYIEADAMKPASLFSRILGRPRVHIAFDTGTHWILEVISVSEFFTVLEDRT